MTRPSVSATLDRLAARLLEARDAAGHWTGELASSALSTATAVVALHLAGGHDALVERGLDWLEAAQRSDGGWGDTGRSISNISTTALCWAAFALARPDSRAIPAVERWLTDAAGSLAPPRLAAAISARYGEDRTFSAPILTVLAVAGKVPWSLVPQLPFELAAFPQAWFRWLRLPVVSYALPALIAIGQARHLRRPSWNPLTRAVRALASGRSLEVLERIQPENGGFLEATPLTSFVALSLEAAGLDRHPVLARCLGFLARSVRPDGSWPIDTNLATWVTTLSVNALRERLPEDARGPILEWLLRQHHTEVHPYTGAAPGGWAWTDLPGGVPDADDTGGTLLALHRLGADDPRVVEAAELGIRWLLGLENADGGIPTFCRGWGRLPFDRSSPEITAQALRAYTVWRPSMPAALGQRLDAATRRGLRFLERTQRPSGAWVPLWFGNQYAENDENPVYGTAKVLLALEHVAHGSAMTRLATDWLLSIQNPDGGWGGGHGIPSSIEETALVVAALAGSRNPEAVESAARGAAWLIEATRGGAETPPTPIGFYFARLWYYERLYPLIFAVDGLGRGGAPEA